MLCEKNNNNNNNGKQSKFLICVTLFSLSFLVHSGRHIFPFILSVVEPKEKEKNTCSALRFHSRIEYNGNKSKYFLFFSVKMVNVNLNMRKKHETPKKKRKK